MVLSKGSKKTAVLLLILLFVFGALPLTHAAISDGYIYNNQYYAVSFDGEGDAVVRARLTIENTIDRGIERLFLEVPGRIVVYKAVQEHPGFEVIEFEKQLTADSTILILELPHEIRENQTGAIVLLYKISRYAEKDLAGNYNFDFETIVDNEAVLVENVRVAVNVQEGLHLKGGNAEVDYRPDFFSGRALETAASADIIAPEYKQVATGIEYARGHVKTASNLDGFESFHVKGTYGESVIALYLLEIIAGIAAIIVIAALIKSLFYRKSAEETFSSHQTKKREENAGKGFAPDSAARIAGVSFLSAAAVVVYWTASFVFLSVLENAFYYSFSGMLALLFFVLGVIVSLAALVGPAIYVSSKHGAMEGLLTAIATVVWIVILAIIVLFGLAIIFPPIIYY